MCNSVLTIIKIYILGVLLFISVSLKAQSTPNGFIKNFIIKQNEGKLDELLILSTDTLTIVNQKVNGYFLFSINGFSQSLVFKNGEAVCKLPLKKSSFLYIKYDNEVNNPSNLYYVYKGDNGLNPFKVNMFLLLVIPIGLIMIGYMFKKVIGLAIFLISAYFYFNHSNGLSFGTFFVTVFDGLKHLF